MHLVYEDVLRTLSDMLKGLLTGPWLIGDYGQIEARNLAWLAGDQKLLADFRDGVDIYCDMASTIYKTKVSKTDYDPVLKVPKRQLGKISILGCGYGMGPTKFQAQAEKDYDVLLDEDTARAVVGAYRKRFNKVVAFWHLLERGMVQAIDTGARALAVGPVRMGVRDIHGRHFAYIGLPSGRNVYYLNPHVDREGPPRISYEGRNILTHKWERIESYGGRLAENTDQADARDLLAHSMLGLEAAGFRMAWSSHDENVSHDDGQKDGLAEFTRIMLEVPEWHEGIPLAVEAFASWRYRK
jgi:DNA polymerase